jgi:predicted outer membrane protein
MRITTIAVLGLCFIASTTANAAELTDAEIAYTYIQGNLYDVEEAELGIARGTAAEVKEHGEMVARDHRGVVKAFEDLLAKQGIKPVVPAGFEETAKQHQAEMADLRGRSGADFDREYLTRAIVSHRAFIVSVSDTLLPEVKNPALAAHMKEVLPAFKKHLTMTIQAAKKVGADAD